MGMLEYHNFSIKGDPRWANTSRFTRLAPIVVSTLFFLSLIQIILGAIWVVSLQASMTIPKILQTLILPGLAFFNTLPSLHLHMLARRNPPIMAVWFSSSLAILFLGSSILYLVSCSSSSNMPLSLRQAECARGVGYADVGPSKALWALVVAFGLLDAVLYLCHAVMAFLVLRALKAMEEEEKVRGPQVVDDATAQEVRDRWERLGRYEL